MSPQIHLKRAYETKSDADGARVLVERLWPRGLSREQAAIDHWVKDLAPSADLRRWYGHRRNRWPAFKDRYREELCSADPEQIAALVALCRREPVTFILAARDVAHSGALVLRDFIAERVDGPGV